jgi:hypothetical protein
MQSPAKYTARMTVEGNRPWVAQTDLLTDQDGMRECRAQRDDLRNLWATKNPAHSSVMSWRAARRSRSRSDDITISRLCSPCLCALLNDAQYVARQNDHLNSLNRTNPVCGVQVLIQAWHGRVSFAHLPPHPRVCAAPPVYVRVHEYFRPAMRPRSDRSSKPDRHVGLR